LFGFQWLNTIYCIALCVVAYTYTHMRDTSGLFSTAYKDEMQMTDCSDDWIQYIAVQMMMKDWN